MKKILLIVIFYGLLLNCNMAFAQFSQIKGNVLDSDSKPLDYFTAAILNPSDSRIITGGAFTDGYFEFQNIKKEKYLIQISCVGYQTVTRPIDFSKNNSKDIGTVQMKTLELDEVIVRAKRPTFRQVEGKLIIDVKGTALSEAGDLFDALKRSPGLIVDNENNISVLGKGTPIIFINNREVQNKAELDNLQSDDIASIEIDRNPSAEYSASGMAVVRIKTKKITKDKISLQIFNRDYFARKFRTQNGIQLNSKINKTTASVNYSHGYYKSTNYDNSYEINSQNNYVINNRSSSVRNATTKRNNLFASINQEISKRNNIGLQYSHISYGMDVKSNARQHISRTNEPETEGDIFKSKDGELQYIDFDDYLYVGYSSQFYQWIFGDIIAERISTKHKDVNCVMGGFSTKAEAQAFLKNFPCFNYATWGEGEYSTIALSQYLSMLNYDIDKIPNLVYRTQKSINTTNHPNQYVSLDTNLLPDFSDFFQQIKKYPVDKEISLPIEGGRGCHWRKCHFCFLNSGYKFRTKSPVNIKKEILHQIKKFSISSFIFLDNDIMGNDLDRFKELLSCLIEIKQEYNDFKIILAEFTTRQISYDLMKKMSLAGFTCVQIGYESASDELLRKISKLNSFASNLLAIKWLIHFRIKIGGLNVLRNLLEETSEDVKEATRNIYYLRFFLEKNYLEHNLSFLAVSKSSPYYARLKKENRLQEWNHSALVSVTPPNYIANEDRLTLANDYLNLNYNKLWDLFEKLDNYYKNNTFSFKLIDFDNKVFYTERLNSLIINELEFDQNDSYWKILCFCNKEITSIEKISKNLPSLDIDQTKQILRELKEEGLIYTNKDYTEICTVINTDEIN